MTFVEGSSRLDGKGQDCERFEDREGEHVIRKGRVSEEVLKISFFIGRFFFRFFFLI